MSEWPVRPVFRDAGCRGSIGAAGAAVKRSAPCLRLRRGGCGGHYREWVASMIGLKGIAMRPDCPADSGQLVGHGRVSEPNSIPADGLASTRCNMTEP